MPPNKTAVNNVDFNRGKAKWKLTHLKIQNWKSILKIGQVLNNRYQIKSTLGEGGFGAVYKAWDNNLQRLCTIKENLQVGGV